MPAPISSIRVNVKVEKLGDLRTTVGIDPRLGIFTLFKVKKNVGLDKLKSSEKEAVVDGSITEYKTKTGSVKISSVNTPSFDAAPVYFAFIAAIERGHGTKGLPITFRTVHWDAETGEQTPVVLVSHEITLNISQREMCRLMGKAKGPNVVRAIKGHIEALKDCSITDYDENGNISRVYRLLVNANTQGTGFNLQFDSAVIDMFQRKNHRIHWQTLLGLSSQIDIATALYLECNNHPDPKSGKQWICETLLMQYVFSLSAPKFNKNMPSKVARVEYKLAMDEYDQKCLDYRKKLREAFGRLYKHGILESWEMETRTRRNHTNVTRWYKVERRHKLL